MKILNIILLLIVFTSCEKKSEFVKTEKIISEIDKITNQSDIENYIQKCHTNLEKFELKKLQDFNRTHSNDKANTILANKLNVKTSFVKVDFDNNGLTDLLAIGNDHSCYGDGDNSCNFSAIVIMNFGKNKTKTIDILRDIFQSVVPKVEYIDNQPVLSIYQSKMIDLKKKKYRDLKSTLIFKFDNFIEYNKNPKQNKISKIEFNTSGCFGTCPIYKLTINRDSISVFNAQYFNFSDDRNITYGKEEGLFYTSINKIKFNELEKLLNYLDFENLNNEYNVSHTDDQTGDLKITYGNGKVKKISDYGMVGTYGLKTLYQKLSELRFNQKWRKN